MTGDDALPPVRRPDPRRLEPERYPFQVELQTRWGDMDVMHHLNNASLSRYYEEARIRFMHDLAATLGEGFGGLVAAAYVDYLRPALYPQPLTGGVAVGAIGTSSLRLAQALFQDGSCVGVAEISLVRMAPGRKAVRPISDEWRDVLDTYRFKM